MLAAGNVPESLWSGFPNSNLTYGVEQPGQAWNALTVGACTHMDKFPGNGAWAGWKAVASSTRSATRWRSASVSGRPAMAYLTMGSLRPNFLAVAIASS